MILLLLILIRRYIQVNQVVKTSVLTSKINSQWFQFIAICLLPHLEMLQFDFYCSTGLNSQASKQYLIIIGFLRGGSKGRG